MCSDINDGIHIIFIVYSYINYLFEGYLSIYLGALLSNRVTIDPRGKIDGHRAGFTESPPCETMKRMIYKSMALSWEHKYGTIICQPVHGEPGTRVPADPGQPTSSMVEVY